MGFDEGMEAISVRSALTAPSSPASASSRVTRSRAIPRIPSSRSTDPSGSTQAICFIPMKSTESFRACRLFPMIVRGSSPRRVIRTGLCPSEAGSKTGNVLPSPVLSPPAPAGLQNAAAQIGRFRQGDDTDLFLARSADPNGQLLPRNRSPGRELETGSTRDRIESSRASGRVSAPPPSGPSRAGQSPSY